MRLEQKALNHFGNNVQKLKLIEEMAELTQAILKNSNVAEEIADVQIVLNQIKILYPDWKMYKEFKEKKLLSKINGNWTTTL